MASYLFSARSPFVPLFSELERILTAPSPLFPSQRVSVDTGDDGITVSVEAPGLEVSDISVEVKRSVLKVKASASSGSDEVRSRRSFSYRWDLGFEPDASKVTASYRAGVLTVVVPSRIPAADKGVVVPVTSDTDS